MGLRGSEGSRSRCLRLALLAVISGTALLVGVSPASATVFTNSSLIAITDLPNGAPDNASPYPSSIDVSGLGTVTDVNVTVHAFNHTHPDDIGLVLVAPGGQALELMNAAGDDTNAIDVDFTFDDSAAGQLPPIGALSTGTYKPTSYDHLLYPTLAPVSPTAAPDPTAAEPPPWPPPSTRPPPTGLGTCSCGTSTTWIQARSDTGGPSI